MSGQYVDLPGVKTWYEVEGSGEPLVLLHGGMVTIELWEPQRGVLASDFQVFLPERRGHGHTPDVGGPLSYHDMAKDTIDFLTTVVGKPAHLVGWSDGGNVALLVAIERPDLVRKLVIVGANFRSAKELGSEAMLDALTPDSPDLAMPRGLYEAASPDGPEHWATFLNKIKEMWRTEPNISLEDLGRVTAATLVMVGDDDQMPLDHTVALYHAVPDSELAVVPRASHAVLMEKPELANRLLIDFLKNEPTPTMMPIRRSAADTPH